MYESIKPTTDRREYSFEGQIQQLHKLASQLEFLVQPFSVSGEQIGKTANTPIQSTQLGRELDSVISLFEDIISKIQP